MAQCGQGEIMLIKVHTANGVVLFVNTLAVRFVEPCNEASLHFAAGVRSWVFWNAEEFVGVRETVEEIENRLTSIRSIV